MIRLGVVAVGLMAGDTLGRLIAERTAGVALDALAADVRSRQREACRAVIK